MSQGQFGSGYGQDWPLNPQKAGSAASQSWSRSCHPCGSGKTNHRLEVGLDGSRTPHFPLNFHQFPIGKPSISLDFIAIRMPLRHLVVRDEHQLKPALRSSSFDQGRQRLRHLEPHGENLKTTCFSSKNGGFPSGIPRSGSERGG